MDFANSFSKQDESVLCHMLRLLRFSASVFFHSSYCGEWEADIPEANGRSIFHVIADGQCWLHLSEEEKPRLLKAGDLLIFPRSIDYVISNRQFRDDSEAESDDIANETPTYLICGYFLFDVPKSNPIVQALPDVISLNSREPQSSYWLTRIVDMMMYEIDESQIGSEAVIDKLAEILFVYVVRYHLETTRPNKNLFAALTDSRLGEALKAFHQQPDYAWTVDKLARAANMSRSGFASLFSEMLEQTPLQYMTYWRMQLAYKELLETQRTVLDIATSVGYQNEASFRKAFKKVLGITPGEVKKY